MNPLEQRLIGTSGGRILDVATGLGGFILALTETFESYQEAVGIDSSEKMISLAEEKFDGDNVRFEVMQAEKIDYEDNSFDTVVIRNSLHHLDDADLALDEMKRVLKPGGLLIVCEMYQNKELRTNNPHVMLHHWFAEIDRMNGITHNETFHKPELMETIKKLGLRGLETFEYTEPKDNELHKEGIDGFIKRCDTIIDRLGNDPKYKKLVERGKTIKHVFMNQDFDWAPQMYIIGLK